ncbi:universal stress protein [Dactylococcopsis salina]|uniref:Universal stress protein UspA-like protein n=1 Tax=Dactylococcopsis salina (strain PCC 8305) TaxID=13035 RepID=K9YT82_DACS8|nr:universal stress protein [Dactylococcopsis salina]AFZ49677.1 universal stress protein UspA-like protein [Dactylococcopsis salina PCC 8305]
MFKRCLICTDFTDGLDRFASFVPSLSASGVNCLVFLHSVPYWEEGEIPHVDEEKVEAAKKRLQVALENVPDGIEVKVEVPSGRPSDTIPRIVEREKIEIVLAGTPIRSFLQEKVFGSTSLSLARATSAPLMIFRPNQISVYTKEELELRCQHLWRSMLIPYNDSEAAQYLVKQIKNYFENDGASSLEECILLWVINEGGRMPEETVKARQEEAEKRIAEVKQDLESIGLKVETQVRRGNPTVEIINAVMTKDVSAIAVGSDDRGGLLQWTVPSLANEILRSSWYPVLFFSQARS